MLCGTRNWVGKADAVVVALVVQEGSSNLVAGQTLAVIVPEASDIETFLHALKENPNAIEGTYPPVDANTDPDACRPRLSNDFMSAQDTRKVPPKRGRRMAKVHWRQRL